MGMDNQIITIQERPVLVGCAYCTPVFFWISDGKSHQLVSGSAHPNSRVDSCLYCIFPLVDTRAVVSESFSPGYVCTLRDTPHAGDLLPSIPMLRRVPDIKHGMTRVLYHTLNNVNKEYKGLINSAFVARVLQPFRNNAGHTSLPPQLNLK